MSKRRTSPKGKQIDKALAVDERRLRVVALRRRGASIADIARTLEVSPSTVSADLRAVLRDTSNHHEAQEVRTLELERLDRMFLAVWDGATQGDDKKIATALRIMERRARYLGLDAEPEQASGSPVQIVVNPQLFPPAVQANLQATVIHEDQGSDDEGTEGGGAE